MALAGAARGTFWRVVRISVSFASIYRALSVNPIRIISLRSACAAHGIRARN